MYLSEIPQRNFIKTEEWLIEHADQINWSDYYLSFQFLSNEFFKDFKTDIDFMEIAVQCIRDDKPLALKKLIYVGAIHRDELDKDSRSLIIICSVYDSVDCIKYLHGIGVDIHRCIAKQWAPPIVQAATQNSPKALKLLLELGVDPNYQSTPSSWTVLYAALERRASLDMIKALLDAGADMYIRNVHNQSPWRLVNEGYVSDPTKDFILDYLKRQEFQQKKLRGELDYKITRRTI